ncbi:MAG: hypothetical protein AAF581_10795 [Planctomycetota bacterium]
MDDTPVPPSEVPIIQHTVSTKNVSRLGKDLCDALSQLLSGDSGELPRPTELARGWSLDQTLCTRVCGALRNDDPLNVLHQLPATISLRSLVAAAEKKGVRTDLIATASEMINELEGVIRHLGGKKSNLDTMIGSQLVEARSKIEQSAKQSIFHGMSNLLGLHCRLSLTSFFVYPSDDGKHCNELAVYGVLEHRRLRPELPILVGGRLLSGEGAEEVEEAMRVLHQGELDDSGHSVALKDFSSQPFPKVEFQRVGKRLLHFLPGNENGEYQEVSVLQASIEKNASLVEANENGVHGSFTFIPRNPAKDMLLDVFVHEDLWRSSIPRLSITRGNRAVAAKRGSALDELDLSETIQPLGCDPRALATKVFPRYPMLVNDMHERMGWNPLNFRLYRLHVKYPVIGLSYEMTF